MTRDEFLKIYWRQYCLMEREFLDTDEYVSIDNLNYNTFSNQYLKLLLTICSEMDSIAEVLCDMHGKPPFGIRKKLDMLVEKYHNLKKYRVNTKYPIQIKNITPLVKFNDSIPEWWEAYNDIKHKRNEKNKGERYNYMKANLKNVLYALAALYILNRTLYESLEEDGKKAEEVLTSNLFDVELLL